MSESASMWIAKVEQLARNCGWSESATICAATAGLRGYAETWYDGLTSLEHSWELFHRAFPASVDYTALLKKMLEQVKMPQEDLLKYFYEKLALINAAEISGEKAVNLLINEIGNETIQHAAKVGNYKQPDDLLIYLKALTPGPTTTTRERVPSRRDVRPKSYQERRDRDVGVRCFYCRKRGQPLPV